MTSEQITELRKLHDGCIAQDLSAIASDETVTVPVYRENAAFLIACNNSIQQLLDERDALLTALRNCADSDGEMFSDDDEVYSAYSVDDFQAELKARAKIANDAIAKAGAP